MIVIHRLSDDGLALREITMDIYKDIRQDRHGYENIGHHNAEHRKSKMSAMLTAFVENIITMDSRLK